MIRTRKDKQPKALWYRAAVARGEIIEEPKHRKRVTQKSPRQRARDARYAKVRAEYLARPENQHCHACQLRGVPRKKWEKPSDVHHKRGKVGELYFDTRYFAAVGRDCHHWIHANIAEARALGLFEKWLEG